MKLLMMSIAVVLLASRPLSADIITAWTFEENYTSALVPRVAEIGDGLAYRVSSGNFVYIGDFGNGSNRSLQSSNWRVGDAIVFEFSTLGMEDIQFNWEQTGHNNPAPEDFQLEYSVNGTDFTTVWDYDLTLDFWSRDPANYRPQSQRSFDFSDYADLDNQVAVVLRLTNTSDVAINSSSVGAVGEVAVDNVTISGTPLSPVPEPSTMILTTMGLAAAGAASRRRGRRGRRIRR